MARISLGSSVKEGPRRGTVLAHRQKGMVDVQFDDAGWVERRPETGLRRENYAQIVIQVITTLLPFIIEGGKKQWATFQRSDRATQRKMLRKWSWASLPARAMLVSNTVADKAIAYLTSKDGKKAAAVAFEQASDPRTQKTLARSMAKNPEDLYDPSKEQFRRVQMAVYESQLKKGLPDHEAWPSSFAIATREGQRHGWLKPGTQTPTKKGKKGAVAKLQTPDAWAKRQRYELALGKHRKGGKHRVVPQKHGKRTRYHVQPGGQWYFDETKALARRDVLNGESAGEVLEALELVANSRGRKKGKNPREYSELGGMSRGFSAIPSAARNALADARAMGRLRGQRVVALDQVPQSRKQRFQDARRDLEADIDELDHNFERLSKSVLSEIPGGDYGRTEPARRSATYWLRRAYREGSNEVLAERERKRHVRRARSANPKKKRMKGIAKTGIGYHWADVRTPTPFQGMKPTLYREEGVYYLVYEGRSRKIPRVLADSNSEPGLKGPKWKRDPRVTSALWKDVAETPTRYAIQHPKSGRGSKSDPYRIYDKEKKRYLAKTFTRKAEADKFLWEKQGGTRKDYSVDRPREEQVRSDRQAGEQITAYRTTSRSRAAYVAKHLTFLDVPRGTFEEVKTPESSRRREQVGAFKLYGIGTRPPADRRRKFFPVTYTLVVPRGAPFVNRQFASPAAAAKYALRQRVQEEGKTLRQALQSLEKRMPDYQALSAAQAAAQSEMRRLRLYGFDVGEQSEGRERVVTHLGLYGVSAAPKARWGPRQTKKKTPKDVKAAQRKLDGLVTAVDKVEARLDRLGFSGRPPFILLAHGKGGKIKFTKEGFDLTGPVATVSVSPDRPASVEQIFISATDRETKRLSDLQKKYSLATRDYSQRMGWYEDKTTDESNRLLQREPPREPKRPDLTRKSRSLGHRDLDWLGALRMKQAQLTPSGKRRLRERREERAMSELQTPTGRSPGVRAPSKRQALVSQFQYGQREVPRERLYAKRPERGTRKLTKVQKARKRQELAELEAELAAMQEKKNPFAAIARGATWVVSSPAGRKILAEAAVIGAMMVGEKLMKRGKVSPQVLRYVQARVQKETGKRPSAKEVTAILKQIDPNQDKTLTADEVARILKRKK